MIRIKTAKSISKLAYTGGLGFGPFLPDGTDPFEETQFRTSYDSLQERPGIYGENHVNHRELKALMWVDPWSKMFPDPNATITLVKRASDGSFDFSRRAALRAIRLKPAHPWVFDNATEYGMSRKRSPIHLESLRSEWSYMVSARKYVMTSCSYSEFRAVPPKKGSSVLTYVQNRWDFARSGKVPDVFLETVSQSTLKSMTGAIVDRAKRGQQILFEQKGTAEFPLYPYYVDENENVVSPRQIMLKLEPVTSFPYKLPEVKSFGELAVDAIETLDTNTINMFEFIQGIKKPWELIPKLKNLNKLKTHAGNYLGVQYGILPTTDDLKSLYKIFTETAKPYFDRNNFQVLTAGSKESSFDALADVEVTNRLKISVNPSDPTLSTLSEKLRDIGGFPSVNNLWELIPYSFVIDWFINIGDLLEGIDTRFRMSRLPIMYATTSSKIVVKPYPSESLVALGVSGDIELVLYSRSVSEDAPKPTLSFEVSNELPNHWLEAGALIVTARK